MEECIRLKNKISILKLSQTHKNENIDIIKYEKEKHFNEIPQVYGRAFNEEPWDSNWDAFEQFDPKAVRIAFDNKNDHFIGLVIAYERDNIAYISVLGVEKVYRKQGIGKQLIKNTLDYFVAKRLTEAMLDVEIENEPVVKMYRKLGFEE